ncbi:bifunctional helix-turn-helix transcriptional regulator/GNAT family N-acetyltransferase [Acinetobacter bouvetii]|uniref:Acetyltransferase (GNAT) family protein n=1 Tax=Acinetobacter bouvetii TaxID=202951 RepID=A0A811GAZ6_9GAMM|nr:helix-turn-helix domain-containing GNAT family N-acetyltransferase [Acinetobacter bouvetii]CAB1217275.1 Acetyltransferase (GNAT) family protein [Acinetobacter bouvetii]
MSVHPEIIESIRSASRQMVRELGFMNSTLAATNYSPSVIHTLLELEKQKTMTAAQIADFLGLEKSSISRMVNKLIQEHELQESVSDHDGRMKLLSLTSKGRNTVQKINEFGQMQVNTAMEYLMPLSQQKVADGLNLYASALQSARLASQVAEKSSIQIKKGYIPGVVGRITEMHANFYSKHSGFGQFFESQVATGVAEFVSRLDHSCNHIWTACLDGKIVGSIAIDGEDLGQGEAHLRWFILDDDCRGYGVGRELLSQAMKFCDEQGFTATHLWTFKGLDAARKLYEAFDFKLVSDESGNQWGTIVSEQKFTRLKV